MDRSWDGAWKELVQRGASAERASEILHGLATSRADADATERWAHLTSHVLRPDDPAAVHAWVFRAVYRDWNEQNGPPPAWLPSAQQRSHSNLARLIDALRLASEAEFRDWSVRDRAGFWETMVRALDVPFSRPYDTVLDLTDGPERPRWFRSGRLNIAAACFRGQSEQVALREHREDGARRELTYRELACLAGHVVASLASDGLRPGESVGLLMPMNVEAVAAMLGILLAGGVVAPVAESFAAPEVARRLLLSRARRVIVQDAVTRRGARLPLYPKLDGLDDIRAVVVTSPSEPVPTLRPGDRTWDEFLVQTRQDSGFDPVPRDPADQTFLLFSSGTTADPKVIPWTQTTPIKAAADGYLYHDIQPGNVLAWPTSPGWMMGPWLVFAGLVNRGTVALYDGHPGTPGFCRFVVEAGVTQLGLVPSLIPVWRACWRDETFDWRGIKLFSSTGECSHPDDMLALMAHAGYRPVIEYCGGTEIGGGYITSTVLKPNAPACFNTVAYGLGLAIRDERGAPADRGEVFLTGPSVGLSTELIGQDHHKTYYGGAPDPGPGAPGPLRRHGDQVERLPGGSYRVLGRVDDAMNLGGIKVAAVEIERIWNQHPRVRESVAIAVRDDQQGCDRLVANVVLEQQGASLDPTELCRELQRLTSEQLNPLFRVTEVVVLESLPRTTSNKVVRRLLRAGHNQHS
jgi:acetyl-CoA synthetase